MQQVPGEQSPLAAAALQALDGAVADLHGRLDADADTAAAMRAWCALPAALCV